MSTSAALDHIVGVGIMPSIRVPTADMALFAAETVYAAGIPIVEIASSVPDAATVIAQLTRNLPDFVVGAGTVLDVETARRSADAGASFITSPGFLPDVLEFSLASDLVAIPGALTPTEVIAAWRSGAHMVKIFPCAQLGGNPYIRALKVSLPQIPLIASGGVNQTTAAGFIYAGASSIRIGSELMPRKAVASQQTCWIQELARRFLAIVHEARTEMQERNLYMPPSRPSRPLRLVK